jgi:hypothetical protein
LDFFQDLPVGQRLGNPGNDDQHILGRSPGGGLAAENFPENPFGPVSLNRIPGFTADGYPQPPPYPFIGKKAEDKMGSPQPFSAPGKGQEFLFLENSRPFGKALLVQTADLSLNRQPLATFGPAPVDDLSSGWSAHAGKKSMGSNASGVAGLVSPFHNGFLFEKMK